MRFVLDNVGKITHADVKLDGITVICGENNTGKSTVGKALFGYFTSMYDWKRKIEESKQSYVNTFVFQSGEFGPFKTADPYMLSSQTYNAIKNGVKDKAQLYEIINNIFKDCDVDIDAEYLTDRLYAMQSISDEALLGEYSLRYFEDMFNNNIININANPRNAEINALFRNGKNTVSLTDDDCTVSQEETIRHRAYYISSPYVVDYLNKQHIIHMLSELERNVIETIVYSRAEMQLDKSSNIFDAVANKERVRKVRSLLSRAYKGSTVIKNDRYFYKDEEGNDIDFRSISTGLKAFALIERLLESGKLRQEDVLILDEPEIHLHPEWQMLYAELIVLLQREFDLTILIATHSFHFLESLKFFTEKYGIPERGNFYITRKTEGGYAIDEEDNTLESLMESLSQPVFDLSDMKFEFEMEQNHEDEDDTE